MKFKNYINTYTGDNRIYSLNDITQMSLGDVLKNKEELLSQYRVLGVPTEKELQDSDNVVYVQAYTRDDGTEVKAHYRSKPESGNTLIKEVDNSAKDSSEKLSTKTDSTNIQDDNYINESMPEIAGVKCGKPMTPEQAGGKNVNPNYDKNKNDGYSKNCAACNACLSARLLGYNIEALPYDESNKTMVDLSHHPNIAYVDPNTGKVPKMKKINVKNAYECGEWLEKSINTNEKYAFAFRFKDEGIDHIIQASKDDEGEIVLSDPQRNVNYSVPYLLNRIKYNEKNLRPKVFRVDNLIMNSKVMNAVSQKH